MEDVGTGILLLSHAHAKVTDPRFQDVPSRGAPNGRPITPASLVVHKAASPLAWAALAAYFEDGGGGDGAAARARGGCSAPPLEGL